MAPSQHIRIFLSSPGDVAAERDLARELIKDVLPVSPFVRGRVTFDVISWDDPNAQPGLSAHLTPQEAINRKLPKPSSCDIVIVILWSRMGTPLPAEVTRDDGTSYQSGTEWEYEDALKVAKTNGRPDIFVYRRTEKPLLVIDDPGFEAKRAQYQMVQNFFARFQDVDGSLKGSFSNYTSPDEFRGLLRRHLESQVNQLLEAGAGAVGTQATRRRHDFYGHESMPENYVVRKSLLAEVRNAVLADASLGALTSSVRSKPAALHGLGGIGKSVLARALCEDPEVRAAFPDGILWTSLGQAPALETKLREWLRAFDTDIPDTAPSVDSLKASLAGHLDQRACLLIVDDVWEKRHARAFQVAGPRCRLLITTRDAALARDLGARIHQVPGMTKAESLRLLDEWADGRLDAVALALKDQIVDRLARLPLAIRLAGAQLRSGVPDAWLASFQAKMLRAERPEDVHDSLARTFSLSLDALREDTRRLYAALAIFEENEPVPEEVVSRLWHALTGLQTKQATGLIDDLSARALLELVPAPDGGRTIRLHDLLRELTADELGTAGIRQTHEALLDSYRGTRTGTRWTSAPDDGYLYNHLVYHLAQIGAYADLSSLFADEQWLHARGAQQNYSLAGYIDDLMTAWRHAHTGAVAKESLLADCFRYALIHTSLNSMAANHPPAVVARALELDVWTSVRALGVASRIPDPKSRIEMYVALIKTDKLNPEERRKAKARAVAALTIESIDGATLSLLAPYLEIDDFENVFALVSAKRTYDHVFAENLAALVPVLSDEWLERSLEAASNLPSNTSTRASLLKALIPHLPATLLSRALEATLSIDPGFREFGPFVALAARSDDLNAVQKREIVEACLNEAQRPTSDRGRLLSAVFPRAEQPTRQHVLNAILGIQHAETRNHSLKEIAPSLTKPEMAHVLDWATAYEPTPTKFRHHRPPSRDDVLAPILMALAPALDDAHLLRATDAAAEITDRAMRGWVRATLAEHMTSGLKASTLGHAWEDVQNGWNHSARSRALRSIAAQSTGDRREEALQLALDLCLSPPAYSFDPSGLADLAPLLSGALLQRGLDATLAVPHEAWHWGHLTAVSALAPRLSGSLWRRTLDLVVSIPKGIWPGDQIVALFAPQLDGASLQRVLDAYMNVPDGWSRVSAATTLARNIPQSGKRSKLIELGLEWTLSVQDTSEQIMALRWLAPHLDRRQLSRSLSAALRLPEKSAGTMKLSHRAEALEALGPHLEEDLLECALEAARALSDRKDRVTALAALIPALPRGRKSRVREQALNDAFAVDDGWDRNYALKALIPVLPGKGIQRVLEYALEESDLHRRVSLLQALLAGLNDEQRARALPVALASALAADADLARISSSRTNDAAWLSLTVPHLEGELVGDGLEGALALDSEPSRLHALVALAPRLSGPFLQRGFDALEQLDEPARRVELLIALAPQASEPRRSQHQQRALEMAPAISDPKRRAWLMAELSPTLTGAPREEAIQLGLRAAAGVHDPDQRYLALKALFPGAPDEVALLRALRETLAACLMTNRHGKRASVLGYLERIESPPYQPETVGAVIDHLVDITDGWHWL